MLKFVVYLYKNVLNILWEHVKKFKINKVLKNTFKTL